jgi:glycosyltransferase 2 family protein
MTTSRNSAETARSADAPASRRGLSLRGLAQALVGVIALALVIIKSDARGLVEIIKSARMSFLPLAVMASFAVTWLMAYRWGAILSVRGQSQKTHRLFAYYLIGIFFTNFVPGGGVSGDVARLIYVDREVRDKAFALSTIIYERLVALFTILLIGLASTAASRGSFENDRITRLGEATLALAAVATIALMNGYASARLARLCRMIGERFNARRIFEAAARTIEAISDLRKHKRMLAITIALSVLIRVVWGLGCYVVALALNLPLGPAIVFAFISLVDLVRLLPISIGGLGVREWLIIALFASVGVEREPALAFSLLAFAPIYLNAIAGGIVYISMAKLKREEKQVSELDFKSSEV